VRGGKCCTDPLGRRYRASLVETSPVETSPVESSPVETGAVETGVGRQVDAIHGDRLAGDDPELLAAGREDRCLPRIGRCVGRSQSDRTRVAGDGWDVHHDNGLAGGPALCHPAVCRAGLPRRGDHGGVERRAGDHHGGPSTSALDKAGVGKSSDG
jgi:hypothetical protein